MRRFADRGFCLNKRHRVESSHLPKSGCSIVPAHNRCSIRQTADEFLTDRRDKPVQIGLIGGIGPAATDYYYQNIIRAFDTAGRELELTMVHTGSPTLLKNLAANKIQAQVKIYDRLTKRLVAAGAGCVAVTSIAGHFCIEEFKKISPLPVIDMIEETNRAVAKLGYKRIGILGTRTVMESRFYGGLTSAEIIPPDGDHLDAVHEAYVTMAAAGKVNEEQKAIFTTACSALMKDQAAQAIMLGGTDLALVYQEGKTDFPVIDCAAIHCDAVTARVLGERVGMAGTQNEGDLAAI